MSQLFIVGQRKDALGKKGGEVLTHSVLLPVQKLDQNEREGGAVYRPLRQLRGNRLEYAFARRPTRVNAPQALEQRFATWKL